MSTSVLQKVALIQGASRGMGLEYVRQLLRRPNYKAPPGSVEGLEQLRSEYADRCFPVQMDCSQETSIENAAKRVKDITKHLDLLVNVAGVLHTPDGLRPEKSFKQLKAENLMKCMSVNAIGPALVMKNFSDLVIAAESENGANDARPAIMASHSARVSNISENILGGWYSYRASKTALNQLNKCFSIEMKNKKKKVCCILLHPGTVDTEMSVPFRANVPEGKLFSKEKAVEQLLKIIDSVTMESTGKFFAWDGSEVNW